MAIEHFDMGEGGSRLVIHNNVAYFTGHVSPFFKTLREQTEGICKRYDELFLQFGLKKENIPLSELNIDLLNRIYPQMSALAKSDEERKPFRVIFLSVSEMLNKIYHSYSLPYLEKVNYRHTEEEYKKIKRRKK